MKTYTKGILIIGMLLLFFGCQKKVFEPQAETNSGNHFLSKEKAIAYLNEHAVYQSGGSTARVLTDPNQTYRYSQGDIDYSNMRSLPLTNGENLQVATMKPREQICSNYSRVLIAQDRSNTVYAYIFEVIVDDSVVASYNGNMDSIRAVYDFKCFSGTINVYELNGKLIRSYDCLKGNITHLTVTNNCTTCAMAADPHELPEVIVTPHNNTPTPVYAQFPYVFGGGGDFPPYMPPTSGGGGGGGGSTSGTGGGPLDGPCSSGNIYETDITWFNNSPDYNIDISSNDLGPCASSIVSTILNQSNSTIKIIKDLFSESSKFNMNFVLDNTISGAARAVPSPNYEKRENVFGKFVKLDVTIKINPTIISSSTKLYTAESIMHEMLHAYFFYRQSDAFGDSIKEAKLAADLGFLKAVDPNANPFTYGAPGQHEQMASSYIEKLAQAIKEYYLIDDSNLNSLRSSSYPNLTLDEYYRGMAWAGLTESNTGTPVTKAWETLKNSDLTKANMYQFIITSEQNGTTDAPSQIKCQ